MTTKNLTIIFISILASFKSYGQENYLEKGNSYLNSKEYEKAEKLFKKAIKSQPENLIYQCQLALSLSSQNKFDEAEKILNDVLQVDSLNVGALWYSGTNYFKAGKDRKAISKFEKAILLLNKEQAQYPSAHWYIGKSYSILLNTEGLTYNEVDRMLEGYETYLSYYPNSNDTKELTEYLNKIKRMRPPKNVLNWVYKTN